MKLKFSAEVKREVNMSSTAWEKGPWGVKSLVRSRVGSCSWSLWQSSRWGATVKEKGALLCPMALMAPVSPLHPVPLPLLLPTQTSRPLTTASQDPL